MFLNAGLVKRGEAGTIGDENQEHRNIKHILKGQGQQWSCPFLLVSLADICYI